MHKVIFNYFCKDMNNCFTTIIINYTCNIQSPVAYNSVFDRLMYYSNLSNSPWHQLISLQQKKLNLLKHI